MAEHLTREQIAALLDEPGAVADGPPHLDVCSECAGEFEAMSRTRMALSGLPDLRAPDGAWDAILAGLSNATAGRPYSTSPTWWGVQERWGPLLAAAAILVLFLGGLGVGRMLAPGQVSNDAMGSVSESVALQGSETAGSPGQADVDYPEYVRSVADLQELIQSGPSQEQIADDPALAAVRLTRLDALIEASREALREAPADPALNDFLFDAVDERASIAGQLGRTIRQASMEY
jgi:hypothetical protein